MIASLFRKSTPFNYTVLIALVAFFYLIFQFSGSERTNDVAGLIEKAFLLGLVFSSLFILNFIVKKNGLSRDNSYAILFFFLFLLFFPSVFDNFNLCVSNFFVLLALRRLVSLQSLKAPKEKIFDASLWIFLAALFHFWAILFIVLVFISILFHVSRDYRNWILPFIAFASAAVVFFLFAFIVDETRIDFVSANIPIDVSIDYFTDSKQNLALSMYAPVVAYFVFIMVTTLPNRPLILQSSYKKIILAFVVGVAVFIVSPFKSNEVLVFTLAPLAIMASTIVETTSSELKREITVGVTAVLAIVSFFMQL
ncbi:DUF6427 family protein [Flavobacterium selenitireducens]|uniref:DUF6427 family protein n=1 Tax=Flavobacterium selenitireducens TaxID=2722704 RepID=UPI00168A6B99|nr:DUF6427 family protein [Flavobacterium selenitireducens]MBD3581601.1 hypothetical protein [Flavobacterium selenitireducens]